MSVFGSNLPMQVGKSIVGYSLRHELQLPRSCTSCAEGVFRGIELEMGDR